MKKELVVEENPINAAKNAIITISIIVGIIAIIAGIALAVYKYLTPDYLDDFDEFDDDFDDDFFEDDADIAEDVTPEVAAEQYCNIKFNDTPFIRESAMSELFGVALFL